MSELFVEDESSFATMLGPEMTAQVMKVSKAMCAHNVGNEDGECTCATDGCPCVAFCFYGHLAHVAILAMKTDF